MIGPNSKLFNQSCSEVAGAAGQGEGYQRPWGGGGLKLGHLANINFYLLL